MPARGDVAPLNDCELTGRARTHVVHDPRFGCFAHPAALAALGQLYASARRVGIVIEPVSAFRDFDAQAKIWNDKYFGRRPLYDRQGATLDFAVLDQRTLITTILQWSALPGASRHHWGSEFDVIDRAAAPEGHVIRLLPDEFARGGVFERLDRWLEENASVFGFFRPYRTDHGGVCPEPWHLSYAPIAIAASRKLTPTLIANALDAADVGGKAYVLPRLAAIYARYVARADPPN